MDSGKRKGVTVASWKQIPVKERRHWKRPGKTPAQLLAPHNINICYAEHTKYSNWQDRRMKHYEQEQKNKSVHL